MRVCTWFIAGASLLVLLGSLGMNTTVAGPDGQRVCNVGLIHDQSMVMEIAGLFLLVAVIYDAAAFVRGAQGEPCPRCREPVKRPASLCPHCRSEIGWTDHGPIRRESAEAAARQAERAREAQRQQAVQRGADADVIGDRAVEDWQRQAVRVSPEAAQRAARG